ncbi:MAG: hypothetical protein RLO50_13000 [Azospirillaceae bacterium]
MDSVNADSPDAALLAPPDLAAYRRGNTGIDYCHRIDSGRPGPTVLVNGLSKGDELCGLAAVLALLDAPPALAAGSLVLTLANVAAFERFDAADPAAAKFVDANFNRIWRDALLDDPAETALEVVRARALRPLVASADVLLDIMSNCHWRDDPSAWRDPPLLAFIDKPAARDLAARIPVPAHHIACDRSPGGGMLYEYGALGDPAGAALGLLSESGPHLSPEARDTGIAATLSLLAALGMVDPDLAEAALTRCPREPVRLYDRMSVPVARSDAFRWAGDFRGHERFARGEVIAWDGAEPLSAPYDDCVLIAVAPDVPKGTGAGHLIRHVSTG